MIKRITSLTLAFSGLTLLVSSIVLYIGPPSHVGHFSPWSFWGLSKHHWGAMHLNGGILFCIAMLIHVYHNWRLLISYMKRKKKQPPVSSYIPVFLSLVLTLFVCTGSYHNATPMKQIMGVARGLKMNLVQKYSSPPYGRSSDYPVAVIAAYMGWNTKAAFKQLQDNNIIVDSPKQPLMEVARKNRTTIGHLLDIMHTN
ncbi:DUF4405 domain-containing protein [Desulfobacula toluolica]|uniref:Conserved uncharacterized protein n=1 Tax=Desulfobacula toluolica (strain DSM 7467 / Tol2) TaxID=651182 RepID=K0NB22_DESTT|nr:DUF4405 domain-containing protein [Desulfobacula toluolica]CCK81459.1 conserved uncharacterized protein [Desulfobacula toluolica Tol2]